MPEFAGTDEEYAEHSRRLLKKMIPLAANDMPVVSGGDTRITARDLSGSVAVVSEVNCPSDSQWGVSYKYVSVMTGTVEGLLEAERLGEDLENRIALVNITEDSAELVKQALLRVFFPS